MRIVYLTRGVIKTSLNLLGACLLFISPLTVSTTLAEGVNEPDAIPHVGRRARESYISYLYATDHKAFAVGPGGAWAWQEGLASAEDAQQKAIEYCQRYTQQRCVTYALNNKLVFDHKQWPTLWGPYLSKLESMNAEVGNKRGQRFYDLAFNDEKGNKRKISDFQGKVVLLHFWGSWCPACMIEFPSLQHLQNMINSKIGKQVELIILQGREPFAVSRQWTNENGFSEMALYDSGAGADDSTAFKLADGKAVAEKMIANVYPSSYLIDKNGVVVFAHRGAVNNWLEYFDFIQDVAAKSGHEVLSKTD